MPEVASHLISLIGLQPGALAIALKTWAEEHGPATSLALLATGEARPVADRIASWAKDEKLVMQCRVLGLKVPRRSGGRSNIAALIRRWRSELTPDARIGFLADTGLTARVIEVALQLPDGSYFLHSHAGLLHGVRSIGNADSWHSWPLKDIGVDTLFHLHDLEEQHARVTNGMYQALRLRKPGAPPFPPLDAVRERSGYLMALVSVPNLDAFEKLHHHFRSRVADLNGLQIALTIDTESNAVRERARTAHWDILDYSSPAERDTLRKKWESRPGPLPAAPRSRHSTNSLHNESYAGAGGAGQPLVLWMNAPDPSPTLISLWTFQPKAACVFFDESTPGAEEAARRLADQSPRLPVDHVSFFGSDALGRGFAEGLADWRSRVRSSDVTAVITGGRKAHACAMARAGDLQLWELRGDAGMAARLDTPRLTRPLLGADVSVHAYVAGGTIRTPGEITASWMADHHAGLAEFARILVAHLRARTTPGFLSLDPLPEFSVGCGAVRPSLGTIQVVSPTGTWTLGLSPVGGEWFEYVVAELFSRAGADEVVCGLEWGWYRRTEELEVSGTKLMLLPDSGISLLPSSASCGARFLKPHAGLNGAQTKDSDAWRSRSSCAQKLQTRM